MKLQIDTEIKQTQNFEVAAWYEEWVLDHGSYDLERKVDNAGDFGGTLRRVSYVAKVSATIESDNFQSLFAGNPMGKPYDTKQNQGKKGTRIVSFSPVEVLLNPKISIPEESYDQVLLEAAKLLRYEIDIQMKCLNSNLHKPQWMSGHAKRLANLTEIYSKIEGVMGCREYNKKNNGQGWDSKATHL